MLKFLKIGLIANTHGVRGEFKISPLTDDPNRFLDLKEVYLDRSLKGDKEEDLEVLHITNVKIANKFVLLKFKEIDDINSAELYKGKYLKVNRENAVKLPEDTYFICDLIGCEIIDSTLGLIGKIEDILETGSNDVYIVKSPKYKQVLIPAIAKVIKNVDIQARKILVDLPEGLIEDEV